MPYPEQISSVVELEDLLARPSAAGIEMMRALEGDLMILGIAGKMGLTLGRLAQQSAKLAGVNKRIIGVSRFSRPEERRKLESWGIECIACDLLDRAAVASLPQCRNIIYMAGRKFGTGGEEELTWAMNALAPAIVAEHFKQSRIVVFSTGCVYPLQKAHDCGSRETQAPAPVGEYAQSCLARERLFQYCSNKNDSSLLFFRLNYAVDLRYGVLHDIAQRIWQGQPVDNSVPHFNVIWQGDANDIALRALQITARPAEILNVTGPELVSVEQCAAFFAQRFGKAVSFCGQPGQPGYLSNSAKMAKLFGYPRVSLQTLLEWQADWTAKSLPSLNKPTHFEVSDGKF